MRVLSKSFVLARTHAQNAQSRSRLRRQGILNGFRKGRKIVRRIVVDEDDLVGRIGQNLGHTVEADRRTLVEIVSVRVVSAVKDDRNHQRETLLSDPTG